jgi:hypothetical protein
MYSVPVAFSMSAESVRMTRTGIGFTLAKESQRIIPDALTPARILLWHKS